MASAMAGLPSDGIDELLRKRAHRARDDHGTREPPENRRTVDGGRQPERAAQPRRARADPAPPRTSALPRSRRPATRTASVASSPPTARGMSRVHHRIAPKGAAFSAQPSGESQVTHVCRHVADTPQQVGHGEDQQAPA